MIKKQIILVLGLGIFSLASDAQNAATDSTGHKVYDFVEISPEYPGGNEAMYKYLADHIIYPRDARQNGVQGTVFIKFVVEVDGTIQDASIIRSVCPSIDSTALAVVRGMPRWKPGSQQGKTVAVNYTLPIKFVLDSGKKGKKEKNHIP